MSTPKSLRIKAAESHLLKIWMDENLPKMKEKITETEMLHHFIYMGLVHVKIDENGKICIA